MGRAIESDRPMERGTPEWDDRERRRRAAGCQCISMGSIAEGQETVRLRVGHLEAWRAKRMSGISERPKEVKRDGNEERGYGPKYGARDCA